MLEDPGEGSDLSEERPEVVERLKAGYDQWLEDVSSSRGFHAVRFAIGSEAQPQVTLMRQDWRMVTPDGWGRDQKVLGRWEVECMAEGPYDVTVTFANAAPKAGMATIAFRDLEKSMDVEEGTEQVKFEDLTLELGEGAFEASLVVDSEPRGVWHVDIVRR